MDRDQIAVVGAGLGGLAAACTLAARGYSVTIFERNAWTGGKAAVLQHGGFTWDMGPTILTVPSVLRRIFDEAGRELNRELELVPLDPQWRCFYEDGSVLDLHADTRAMAAALDRHAPGLSAGYPDFIDLSRRLHEISNRYFFWRSVGSMWDTFDPGTTLTAAVLRDLATMRLGRTVAGTVRSMVKDPRVAQMLDHFTQYIGSAPDASPAILCAIAHMQTSEGVWYPIGGTGAVARALTRLAKDLGVRIRGNCGVRRIVVDGGRVSAVVTEDGERVPVSAVVSNADAVRTHRELIGGDEARRFDRKRKYEPACSGVVLYLGLDRRYDEFLHHNFVFSRDPHEEFDSIYRKGEPAPDPTCYLCAPAITDPAVAPPGGEALYVLVHAPYLREGHDWQRLFPEYRETILRKIERTTGVASLDRHIVFERALTPQDIHERYGVLNGAIYGIASHGRWTGAFKPGNRAGIAGLYLAGGAAHPGPGMPMVTMSGWIAADALDKDGAASPQRTQPCQAIA